MAKKIGIILIVAVIIVSGVVFLNLEKIEEENTLAETTLPIPNQIESENDAINNGSSSSPLVERKISVVGSNYAFNPKIIEVNQGEKVTITFQNAGGFHDFQIEGYGVGTEKINSGQEQSISFIADKTGSFVFYCSVGQHRAQGMVGTLIVK